MARITRRAFARLDLIEIWTYIADDNPIAADGMLDRFEQALAMLADNPHAGRGRPELANELRSFPVAGYLLFYCPTADGIDLVRVIHGHRDIDQDAFEV